MRRHTGLTRMLWRITAVLQLVLPATLSGAEVRLDRDADRARAFSHVEAATSKDCARVHTADCALCQHLTTPQARANKAALPVNAGRSESPSAALAVGHADAAAARPNLARAPPVA